MAESSSSSSSQPPSFFASAPPVCPHEPLPHQRYVPQLCFAHWDAMRVAASLPLVADHLRRCAWLYPYEPWWSELPLSWVRVRPSLPLRRSPSASVSRSAANTVPTTTVHVARRSPAVFGRAATTHTYG